MEKESKFDIPVHYVMACSGGFIGAYAILSRMEVFGSAQTANLIELVCDILGRDRKEVVIRIVAMLIYMSAMGLTVIIGKKTKWNLKYLAIIVDVAAVTVVGFFPKEMNPIMALYPVFFATAFQWCSFKGAKGYVSSTIFSTNNLKQTVLAATDYFTSSPDDQERWKKAEKALFFGGTLLSFHTGVAVSYVLWTHYGIHSSWFCLLPLLAGAVLVAAREGVFGKQADNKVSVEEA